MLNFYQSSLVAHISLCLIIVHPLTLRSELKISLLVETYISFLIVNCTS
jgi:hypothetical protein